MATSDKISLKERYILEENKDNFFSTLVKNSDTYFVMKLNDHLNRFGLNLSDETKKELETFTRSGSYWNDPEKQKLAFKQLLLKISAASSETERDNLLLTFQKDFFQGHFDYFRPSNIKESQNLKGVGEVEVGSVLEDSVNEKASFEALKKAFFEGTCEKQISTFRSSVMHLLDLEKLLDKHHYCFEYALNTMDNYGHEPNFAKLLHRYLKEKQKQAPHHTIENSWFIRMTLAEMEQFLALYPGIKNDKNFVTNHFTKTFEIQVGQFPTDENDHAKTHETLLSMYRWTKRMNVVFKNLQAQILLAILIKGEKLGVYDKELFLEYLDTPIQTYSMVSQDQRNHLNRQSYLSYDSYWINVHNCKSVVLNESENVIKNYLAHFFHSAQNYTEFEKFFEPSNLKHQFYEAKLKKGENLEKISEIYTEAMLNTINDKKILKFCQTNKSKFEHGEEVNLKLIIKNVPTLTINIFQIDPINYFRKTNQAISAKLNLDGLLPAKQIIETFNHPPMIEFTKNFSFPEIQEKERGIYIIEFIGAGLSSRAMIRKGALTLIHQQADTGLIVHVVNEKKQICSLDTTLMFENSVHKPNETGGFLIPYGKEVKSINAIVTHGDFAEIISFSVPRFTSSFDASLLFNEESLFTGATTEFILQPKLFICGKLVPLSLVTDSKVQIKVVNDKGIVKNTDFDKIKLSYQEDVSIKYLVPPKTKRITITLTGKILDKDSTEPKEVKAEKYIDLDSFENQETYYNTYLKNTVDGGYVIRFLGRNGEPYEGFTAQITLVERHSSKSGTYTLKTDKNGEIQLGKLENFCQIRCDMRNKPGNGNCPSKTYEINRDSRIKATPQDFTIVQGESLQLPADCLNGDLSIKELYYLKKLNSGKNQVIGNYTHLIENQGDLISLKSLEAGTYEFKYLKSFEEMKVWVKVIEGERWNINPKYVIGKNSITKLQSEGNFLTYTDFKFDHKSMSAHVISNQPSTVKVHLVGLNHHSELFENFQSNLRTFRVQEQVDVFNFASYENTYLSEKNLSDEINYVLERKSKQTFMGNTLEKPSGLLKRHFNKKTTAETEHLEVERDFGTVAGQLSQTRTTTQQGSSAVPTAPGSYRIFSLNSFLKQQGKNISNIKLDEEGKFSISEEQFEALKGFNTFVLVIEDSKNSIVSVVKNTSKPIEKQSLTLQESKTADKVYMYERQVAQIKKGTKYTFTDLNNTEMSLIEDRSNLFAVLKLIEGDQLSEWSFLEKWDQMKPEEQLTKYDKFACHEFHLFTYFRSNEFFEMVVKDHIINKVEKQFIDHFLLDNKAEMEKYLTPYRVHKQLNMMETCLLVHAFRNVEGKKEICQKIIDHLADRVKNQTFDQRTYKLRFDSVLTAQKSKEEAAIHSQDPMAFDNIMMQQNLMSNMNFSNIARPQQMMMQQAMPRAANFSNISNVQSISLAGGRGGRRANYGYGAMNLNRNANYDNFSVEEDYQYDEAPRSLPVATGAGEKFRTMGVTNEYIERQYSDGDSVSLSVESNKFWLDYMNYLMATAHETDVESKTPFLTENFIYTQRKFEQLMAVCLLDLPETKEQHETDRTQGLSLTAGSNLMIFTKQMKEKGNEKIDLDVIISQRFFDPNDPYVIGPDGKSKMFKKITEFLTGKVYGIRIAITNSSESEHEVAVISEIPQGSIPVQSLEYSKSTTVNLQPLNTEIVEFNFYFPQVGEFTCYPASITKNGFLVGNAAAIGLLKVVSEQTEKPMNTIQDILAVGSKEDILQFMRTNSLNNTEIFSFDSIYWLLKEKSFYQEVIQILKEKFIVDEVVWQFSVLHRDYETFKQYLYTTLRDNEFKAKGFELKYFDSDVLKIDHFQFKEYNPLINPRVHDIGPHKHNILNRDFKNTYNEFLSYLVDKNKLDSKDWLYLALYFILQDRIDDAIHVYGKIDSKSWYGSPEADATSPSLLKIQYDYLTAYLDLYRDYPKFTKARAICQEYLVYPVFTWRNRFIDLANQIAEFDGEVAIEKIVLDDEQSKKDKNDREADKSEYINAELSTDSDKIKITHKNLTEFEIAYYKIDLEIMFSKDPFLSLGVADYSFVKANYSKVHQVNLSSDYSNLEIEIEPEFKSSNMLIQVTSGALTKSLTYFPSSLKAYIIENHGQVKITDQDNKPLSKVYVKCFQKKKDGQVSFYKDGYTDLRGTFDYAALNLDGVGNIDKFSLLVVSQDKGALIKQTNPPLNLAKAENKAMDLASAQWQAQHAVQLEVAQERFRASKKTMAMNKYMMQA